MQAADRDLDNARAESLILLLLSFFEVYSCSAVMRYQTLEGWPQYCLDTSKNLRGAVEPSKCPGQTYLLFNISRRNALIRKQSYHLVLHISAPACQAF